MLKILCFGDSITLGEKDTQQGGWADRLKQDYLKQFAAAQTQTITLYNLGIASETTDGLLARFETELSCRYIKGQKHIIVLAYGANDIVIHKNKNRVPQSYFIRNLKHCIEIAKKRQADVLLLSLLPISDAIEARVNQHGHLRYDQHIQAYNRIIKNLADELHCQYLDLYTHFVANNKAQTLCSDGVHPNSQGHKLLYQIIKDKLSAMHKAIYTPGDNLC